MALSWWERADSLLRERVRDTFGSAVTYTPRNGSPVSVIDEGLSTERPLLAEYTLNYEDVAMAEPTAPSPGPRLEFIVADLIAAGIDASNPGALRGDRVTLSVRDETRTWYVADVADADLGSIYLHLSEREVT